MQNFFCRRPLRFDAIVALSAILVLVPALLLHVTSAYASPNRVTIAGNIVPALQNHAPLGPTASTRQLQFSVTLALRNQSTLDTLLQKQNDPMSSLYHRYLTPQQFTAEFGPTAATVNQVMSYLRSQGLKVQSVSSNNLLIDVSGSVAQVDSAFATSIEDYSLNGNVVYAPSSEPAIPATMNGMVEGINGLDNVDQPHPSMVAKASTSSKPAAGSPPLGPGGGYTPADLRTAYDMNPLISQSDGSGQSIAIIELSGYNQTDINTFLSQYNLGAPKNTNVLVDGATNTTDASSIEPELDLEGVSSIASGAQQIIYLAPNTDPGWDDAFNRFVTDDVAKVASNSWFDCEALTSASQMNTLDAILKQSAVQGQTVFDASGDSGAYCSANTTVDVGSPANDPYQVSVGGTILNLNSDATYNSETAWSTPDLTSLGPNGAGSGGGISKFFPRPSWQTGPGLDSNPGRHIPDVSAAAAPNPGYSAYCTVSSCNSHGVNGWGSIWGTSAAAPLWAATVTDMNAYLITLRHPGLGNADAIIYQLFNTPQGYPAYHDVTTGTNNLYNAGSGYDLATGIGSLDAWNFFRDVAIIDELCSKLPQCQ